MKKILPIAVLSALAGVNGAQAVHVNPDGLGQVLLYPYYTVEGGQDTYINLVNTTNNVKAVKVRFKESLNSKEVLDFNLYLSPNDHWSAVITAGGEGATITSGDTSCTVPNAINEGQTIAFRNSLFALDSEGGVDRTKEGYVEIIEMGDLSDDTPVSATMPGLATAATHIAGVPADCGALSAAWGPGGIWTNDSTDGMSVPTGGLYGYGVLINVAEGTDATYDALALDAFESGTDLHVAPGSSAPALNSGDPIATLFDGSNIVNAAFTAGIDAVSAVLMHDTISNDYVLEPTIDAGTDWVINFPTKGDYVNNGRDAAGDLNPADPPFTSPWDDEKSSACELVGITYYDREEAGQIPADIDFSPQQTIPGFFLCAEANVLTFNGSNVLEASDRGTGTDLSVIYDNGWMELDFAGPGRTVTAASGEVFNGLPTIGFAVQKYVNGDVGGVLSNYAGSVTHKGTRSIVSAPAP